MNISSVLMANYLPYAKGIIIGRAIPAIDGLKPANRRILYTMYNMKLLNGAKTKSTNIVGATMKYHPHGDMSLYDTLVRMTTGNESLNVPYVESKGNLGKVYSRDLAYAASRYTEAKLTPICEELFDGIDEDAVDLVDNYDNTLKEPAILPTKFPNILANPSNGIAVGVGSSIPSFGLSNLCNSVIGILKNEIHNPHELLDVLGIPQFTTGGNIHITRADMEKLLETGYGQVLMTGLATTYPDHIVINELPYKVTSEAVSEAIEEKVKSGELKEIASTSDETDLNGFRLVIHLKRGANARDVLKKLHRLTPLRSSVTFHTRVIIDGECREIGIYDLLNEWIKSRRESIVRVYKFRYNKYKDKEYLLRSWEAIKDDIREVAEAIARNGEEKAKIFLMGKFNLDEAQANYLLDMRIREFTVDRLAKRLSELEETRNSMKKCISIIGSEAEQNKIIISDQERIIKKYGAPNKTRLLAPIDLESEKSESTKSVIDDSPCIVVLTKNYNVKRLDSLNKIGKFVADEGDEEIARFGMKNNEHLLVFTYSGTVYKVLANSIDASGGKMKDNIAELAGINKKEIMFVDACGDYSKHFNVIYPNGKGTIINYAGFKGKRSSYKSLFEASKPGALWWTFEDAFFLITKRRKAAYCNLSLLGGRHKASFKVARIASNDDVFGIQNVSNVPDMSEIDLEKYNRDYPVLIKEDNLWEGARDKYIEEMKLKEAKRLGIDVVDLDKAPESEE